jgi:copper chaperone CopZ
MVEAIRCELCGAVAKFPVRKTIDGRELNFCCAGCLQVYELMRDEGQGGGETPAQVQTKPSSTVDRRHAGTMPSKTITLSIVGMSCANCVTHVEGGLRSVPGVISVDVSLATELAIVEITPDRVTITDLKNAVKAAGYEVLDAINSGEA